MIITDLIFFFKKKKNIPMRIQMQKGTLVITGRHNQPTVKYNINEHIE